MKNNRPSSPVAAHIRIPLEMLNSPAFIALDWTSRALFIDLRSKLRSTNNGNINATLDELRHRGWASSATLAKAIRQLEALGFIRKTRETVGVVRGSKLCNLYRFTDEECFEVPKLSIEAAKATNEWRSFTKLRHALAVAEASAEHGQKKSTLQKLKPDASKIEVTSAVDASNFEVTPLPVTSKIEASTSPEKAREAKLHAALQ